MIDPLTGLPADALASDAYQIPLDSNPALAPEWNPKGRQPGVLYPDNIVPTFATIQAQNNKNPKVVQAATTDGLGNLNVNIAGGGGGGGGASLQATNPVNWSNKIYGQSFADYSESRPLADPILYLVQVTYTAIHMTVQTNPVLYLFGEDSGNKVYLWSGSSGPTAAPASAPQNQTFSAAYDYGSDLRSAFTAGESVVVAFQGGGLLQNWFASIVINAWNSRV